ncbi:MAG TPA: hypothetical protein VIH35_08665, partial [Kiritimatiellia bacterium]
MSKLLAMAVTGLVLAGHASADIAWFNTPTNLVTYSDGLTPLYGYKGSNDISCFIQLFYAGTDDAIDTAQNTGTGATDDDMLVAWSYIGANLPGSPGSTSHYGWVSAGTMTNEIVSEFYYVRVWTAPSADFNNGYVPTDGTNFYGDSALFQALAGFDSPNPPQNLNFGSDGGFAATLTAIP